MTELILASASPRRQELLRLAGFSFAVCAADADEDFPAATPPGEAVRLLARRKAQAVAGRRPDACVLGADTLVALEGAVLGKPENEAQALEMLRLLSGKEHMVYTGVCILTEGREFCFTEATRVRFFPLTEEEIRAYVQTGEPMDKAGAYGIQGRGCTLVERITGDYYSVVGLPIGRVARALQESGIRRQASGL